MTTPAMDVILRDLGVTPCRNCGERCSSQIEHTGENDGKPWPYCSGCDPDLEDNPREACIHGHNARVGCPHGCSP